MRPGTPAALKKHLARHGSPDSPKEYLKCDMCDYVSSFSFDVWLLSFFVEDPLPWESQTASARGAQRTGQNSLPLLWHKNAKVRKASVIC